MTSSTDPRECVPECVPSVSPEGPRADAKRVCPPSPSPTEGDTLSEPPALCPATVSPEPITLPANPRCGGITSNGSWPPPCCEVHVLPWGHDRSNLGILKGTVTPDVLPAVPLDLVDGVYQ